MALTAIRLPVVDVFDALSEHPLETFNGGDVPRWFYLDYPHTCADDEGEDIKIGRHSSGYHPFRRYAKREEEPVRAAYRVYIHDTPQTTTKNLAPDAVCEACEREVVFDREHIRMEDDPDVTFEGFYAYVVFEPDETVSSVDLCAKYTKQGRVTADELRSVASDPLDALDALFSDSGVYAGLRLDRPTISKYGACRRATSTVQALYEAGHRTKRVDVGTLTTHFKTHSAPGKDSDWEVRTTVDNVMFTTTEKSLGRGCDTFGAEMPDAFPGLGRAVYL